MIFMLQIIRTFKAYYILICILSVVLGSMWAGGAVAPAEGPEDVPNLGDSSQGVDSVSDEQSVNASSEDNLGLLNCLCRCVKPKNSDFDCSYNLTPYPSVLGGSPSCGDTRNGYCMCQAIGCFRAPLPTSGECYNACRNQYPGVEAPWGPTEGAEGGPYEPESDEDLPPGNLVPAGVLAFKTETEPNDQIGDANEIVFASPAGAKGQITPAGDVDFFRFYVDSAGMLEVKADQVPDDMKTRIDIYGKNFNWRTRKDASNPGDPITLLVDVPGVGQGLITISDLDRKAHSSDYAFVADFSPAKDDGEPNDQAGDSTEIGFGQTVSAHICPVDDVDFYKLYADSSGIMTVKFDQVPVDMKTRIDLYNKNMNWITRKDASNAGDAITLEADLAGPAAYYIAISDLDRKARADPYTFKATFRPAPDAHEPNNQVGDSTELGLGQEATGYICPRDDVDIYMIRVDAPAILEAKLESVPVDMKARIDLYGKNFNWITRKDASNSGDPITLEGDLGGAGVYYLAVSDLDRKAHDQEYRLMAVLKSG
jgi:hypothetical protein